VPTGFRTDGLPFGVTLVGRCGTDASLLEWAGGCIGFGAATGRVGLGSSAPVKRQHGGKFLRPTAARGFHADCRLRRAHAGAAAQSPAARTRRRLLKHAKTAARYRLFALPGEPVRPGLIRDSHGGGSIEIEVWALRAADLGSFLEDIPRRSDWEKSSWKAARRSPVSCANRTRPIPPGKSPPLGGGGPYLAGSLGRS